MLRQKFALTIMSFALCFAGSSKQLPLSQQLAPQIKENIDYILDGRDLHTDFRQKQAEQTYDFYETSDSNEQIMLYLLSVISDTQSKITRRTHAMWWASQSRESRVTDVLVQIIHSLVAAGSKGSLDVGQRQLLNDAIMCAGFTNRDDVLDLLSSMAQEEYWINNPISFENFTHTETIKDLRTSALQGLANSGTERAKIFFTTQLKNKRADMKDFLSSMPPVVDYEAKRINKKKALREERVKAKAAKEASQAAANTTKQ